MRIWLALLALVACAALVALATLHHPGQSMQDAMNAFMAHDIKEAYATWEKLAAAPGTRPEDRADAQRWLAHLDWWFNAKPDAARERLAKAAGAGVKVPELLCELAKMETSLGRYGEARSAAQKAIEASTKAKDRLSAQLLLATATVTEAQEARLAGKTLPDSRLLSEAATLLGELMAQEPGTLAIARPLLEAALMAGDGPTAWGAWQSYYHVIPDSEVPNLLKNPMAVLQEVLPAWTGGVLPVEKTQALVQALADSRFFPEAAALLRDPGQPESLRKSFSQLLAYQDYLRAVKAIADEYYRQTALGRGSKRDFLARQGEALRRRWTDLGLPGTPGTGDIQELGRTAFPVLAARFGVLFNYGTTAGYFDLHAGHLVTDERRTVEQYGKTAQIRYEVLEGMVSNGFQSWAWCGRSWHGGWGTADSIIEVRSDDTAGSRALWRKGTDPQERKEWDEEIARESKEDELRAAKNACAYLPGLAGRLQRAALDEARTEMDRKRIQDPQARLQAFLAMTEWEDGTCDFFAHEGRHAIDNVMGISDPVTNEFGAKLSEIAFARHPKAMVRHVNDAILGDSTPHGQADLKIVKGLVAWMESHATEIQGFDAKRPTLPQLDKLTDEQLRTAVRSMDPLARKP
jgi:hypothetical protein